MRDPLKKYVSAIISRRLLWPCQGAEEMPAMDGINKSELEEFIFSEGLGPVMYDMLEKAGSSGSYGVHLHRAHLLTAMRNTLLFSEFAEIAEQAEFPIMPLKGTFLSMKVYGNPNLRSMQDIDILVKKQDVPAMEALLRERGYGRIDEDMSGQWSVAGGQRPAARLDGNRVTNSINSIYLRKYVDDSKFLFSDVHVHWHWINASYYLNFEKIDIDEVWKTSREIEWQKGTKVFAMPDELLLLHLAEHNLKHNFRKMIKLLDVAMVLKRRKLDWDKAERYARQFNLVKPLLYTLIFTEDAFPGAVPAGIIRRFDCEPRTHLEMRFERMIKTGMRRTGMNWLVYQAMCGGGYGRLRTAIRLAASLFCREGGLGRLAGVADILGKLPMKGLSWKERR